MQIDADQLQGNAGYKLISGSILPRPIAFVTSLDGDGVVNAAPFSFFNAISGSPPVIVISIGEREAGAPKDSAENIRRSGEFVVNLVDEALVEAMNLCATPFPAGTSEVEAVGLKTLPGAKVGVPRLEATPIALECRARTVQDVEGNTVVIADVLCFHIRDDLYEQGRINPRRLGLVGRLAGATYTRTHDLFTLPRIGYDEWQSGLRPQVESQPR